MELMDEALTQRIKSLKAVRIQVRQADGQCRVETRQGGVVEETGRRDVLIEAAKDPHACRVEELLFIGSQDAAENEAGLRDNGIRAILNVSFSDEAFPGRFRYLRLPLLDVPEQPLAEALGPALAFVGECEREGLPLLVHCNAGVSRSAAVVVAHLMRARGLPYEAALAALRRARPAARPNAGFEAQLRAMAK